MNVAAIEQVGMGIRSLFLCEADMTFGEGHFMKAVRVLIVDDHRDGADSLGLIIEDLGHEVKVTYGGRHALDVATTFQADLFLVDLCMPDVDGFSLVEQLRSSRPFAPSTIIAITGHVSEEHKALALKIGFNAVLFKPVTFSGIKAALASVAAPTLDNTPSRPRFPEKLEAGRHLRLGATEDGVVGKQFEKTT